MKIHIGEFLNLMIEGSVKCGDEVSLGSMNGLVNNGLAEFNIVSSICTPTEKGREVYSKLIDTTIEVKETYEFKF